MLLKLHFEVLFRRVLLIMNIVYYFEDQNRGISRATASGTIQMSAAFCPLLSAADTLTNLLLNCLLTRHVRFGQLWAKADNGIQW